MYTHTHTHTHTQDDHLLDFLTRYYHLVMQLGSEQDERLLGQSISNLHGANPEIILQFLHITLNNLASLLIRPSVTEESG